MFGGKKRCLGEDLREFGGSEEDIRAVIYRCAMYSRL